MLACFWVASVLFVWFQTNVLIEYYSLFGLSFSKTVNKYIEIRENTSYSENLVDYIRAQKNSFLAKLVTCPICLAFWLAAASSLPTFQFVFFNFVCGLVIYYALVMLKKHS